MLKREQFVGRGAVFGVERPDGVGIQADPPLQLVPPPDVNLHGPAEVGLFLTDCDREFVERQLVGRGGDDEDLGERGHDLE